MTTANPAQHSLNVNINLSHNTMNTIAQNPDSSSHQRLTMVIYGLYAASVLTGVTAIVAIVLNYLKRKDMVGTVYESHFRWQMRTFWFGLLWFFSGFIGFGSLIFFGNSMFPLAAAPLLIVGAAVWCIYRIVKGFLRLNDGKAMYAQ